MQVRFKTFRASLASWDELFGQASEFASEQGEMRVINVSHSCDGGNGTVVVWYWSDE